MSKNINEAIIDHNFTLDAEHQDGDATSSQEPNQPFVHDLDHEDFVLVTDDKSKLKKRRLAIAIGSVLIVGGIAVAYIQFAGVGAQQKHDDFAFAKPPLELPVQNHNPAALPPAEVPAQVPGQDGTASNQEATPAPGVSPQSVALTPPTAASQTMPVASQQAAPVQAAAPAQVTPSPAPTPAQPVQPAAVTQAPVAVQPTPPANQAPAATKTATQSAPATKPSPAQPAAKAPPAPQAKSPAPAATAVAPAKAKNDAPVSATGQASGGEVKPLVAVSAAEIGLRYFTPDSISVATSKDTAPQMYRVGDMLPSGERIQHLDAGAMTIVTSRRVIKIK